MGVGRKSGKEFMVRVTAEGFVSGRARARTVVVRRMRKGSGEPVAPECGAALKTRQTRGGGTGTASVRLGATRASAAGQAMANGSKMIGGDR